MKQLILLCTVWFAMGMACYAQTTQDNEYYPLPENKEIKPVENKQYFSKNHIIKLGVKAGISRGSVLMSPTVHSISFAPQTGYSAGLFASITGKHKPVGVQIEPGFINKRSGWVVDYNDTLTEQVFNLRYLTLPVLLKYDFGFTTIKNKPSVYLLFGPEFNVLMDGKLHLQTEGMNNERVFDEDRRINMLEAGVILGLGSSFPVWKDLFLVIEGRGGLGLTNFNKGVVINRFRLRNMYGLISAGFALRL